MKNNMVDLNQTVKNDNLYGTPKEPKKKPFTPWPPGMMLAKDGKSPANCYVIEDGSRFEVEALISNLKKFDKTKKKLVFIVAAGHGTMNCAQ